MTERELYTVTDLVSMARAAGRPISRRYVTRLCELGRIEASKMPGGRRGVWVIGEREARRWVSEWVNAG